LVENRRECGGNYAYGVLQKKLDESALRI